MVLRKDQLEAKLKDDNLLIRSGVLRNEHPLDTSASFAEFLMACRKGDLKHCQELINAGVNINGKDQYDYTPLVIVSNNRPWSKTHSKHTGLTNCCRLAYVDIMNLFSCFWNPEP